MEQVPQERIVKHKVPVPAVEGREMKTTSLDKL